MLSANSFLSEIQGHRCTVELLILMGAHVNPHQNTGETALIKVKSFHVLILWNGKNKKVTTYETENISVERDSKSTVSNFRE